MSEIRLGGCMDSDSFNTGRQAGACRLLLCDIGNTCLKVGIADKSGVLASYALPVSANETADSLGLRLWTLLDYAHVCAASWQACVAASVVPRMNPILCRATERYLGCGTLFVPEDLPVPLENRYERPGEVGADRLVAAWAASHAWPGAQSLIVVDFGTAVTFDCVAGGAYLGGLIFPGPAAAVSALAQNTAKLPHVGLDETDAPKGGLEPCRDTAASIRNGLAFGYAALAEGLCARLAATLPGKTKIVATGGFARTAGHLTNVFDAIMPGLLLDGLGRLYYNYHAVGAS